MTNKNWIEKEAPETFKKWKDKMLQKITKNPGTKPINMDVSQKYWVAKTYVVSRKKLNEFQVDKGTDTLPHKELQDFRVSCVKIKDTMDRLRKFIDEICESDCKLSEFLTNSEVDCDTHSYVIMIQISRVVKSCQGSRKVLVPILTRLNQTMIDFIKHGIADVLKEFKTAEKASIQYQASLLWMDDLSKSLDPDSTEKLKKFKNVQKFVKESRQSLNEQRLLGCEKFQILKSSRNLILTREFKLYLTQTRDYFNKCRSEFKKHLDEFSSLPYYKYKVLEPLLGPNNGVDSHFLDKYIKPMIDDSYKDLAKNIVGEDDADLVDLNASPTPQSDNEPVKSLNLSQDTESSNNSENKKTRPSKHEFNDDLIKIAESEDENERKSSVTACEFYDPFDFNTIIDKLDHLDETNKIPNESNKITDERGKNEKISFFDFEIDDLINYTQNTKDNKQSETNHKLFEDIKGLADEIDSSDRKITFQESSLDRC
ncbi:Islet cell autoantigen 1-like protein [Thelohanellus kitauei]|uniref:Islet cell autoantigen 1-like protein n=1 Tax=Thelohanellus kitauei TaxID=669202 RepID=A0A0C2JA82_THEKT|nr:Islet cell autoantigen 1-like protein [Thelohanellus kitauei]